MRPSPKPQRCAKSKRKHPKSDRRILEAQLEELIRQIVSWRDFGKCIEADVDGVRCGGLLQWGHFTPRRQSDWLKFTLATFVQCGNHNMLHDKGSQTMGLAVDSLLGIEWHKRHEAERDLHRRQKPSVVDLRERLERYQVLWDNRPITYTTEDLLNMGYYD